MSDQAELQDPNAGPCFLEDGKRRVDYVIVVEEKNLEDLHIFLFNMRRVGLVVEQKNGIGCDKTFLLVHITEEALNTYSFVYNVGTQKNKEIVTDYSPWTRFYNSLSFLKTPISSIPRRLEGEFTSCERILVIRKILDDLRFGDGPIDIGILRLINFGFVVAAFPLHDGSSDPDGTENLNDRQLLRKYFANFWLWYKEVPVDMVQRYFGCEVAYYFAWLQFFNFMLIPIALIGIIITIYNIVDSVYGFYRPLEEFCGNDQAYVCPVCSSRSTCTFKPISRYCRLAAWSFTFENYTTVCFALIVSIWSYCFLLAWKRQNATLAMRWSVTDDDTEHRARFHYLETVDGETYNILTGNMQTHMRKRERLRRTTVMLIAAALLIALVLLAVLAVIVFKMCLREIISMTGLNSHTRSIVLVSGCILQVVFIKLYSKMYSQVSIWLTKYEKPRTQAAFDNSFLYKSYLLSFVNNYAALFYIAFVKGRFFEGPDRHKIYDFFDRDTCQPLTCVVDLTVQIFFLLLLKRLVGNLLVLFMPSITGRFKKIVQSEADLPRYEEEYNLTPTGRYQLTSEFCEVVIAYGFVTFFIATAPFAPICVLVNNIIELRLDAFKLVVRYQRPNPRNMSGIGAWDGVIDSITDASVWTTAFSVASVGDLVPREMYKWRYDRGLAGYVNSTLLEFQTSRYRLYRATKAKVDVCYYRTWTYTPFYGDKQEAAGGYWQSLYWSFVVVIVFKNIVMICKLIMNRWINGAPRSVRNQEILDEIAENEERQRDFDENIRLRRRWGFQGNLDAVLRIVREDFVETGPIISTV